MPVTIEAGKLGARIKSDAKGMPRVLKNAMYSAGQRGKAFILGKTPVDRGILRNAWRVVKMSGGVELVNDMPYAGIMERGARPFKIRGAGIEALTGWVKRKILQVGTIKGSKAHKHRVKWIIDDEARSIAWAIAKTIEKVGIKGRRFVYMNLPKIAELMDSEVNRYLDSFFNRSANS